MPADLLGLVAKEKGGVDAFAAAGGHRLVQDILCRIPEGCTVEWHVITCEFGCRL
jgi:hypothetical protein